jgi:hypothetical protein
MEDDHSAFVLVNLVIDTFYGVYIIGGRAASLSLVRPRPAWGVGSSPTTNPKMKYKTYCTLILIGFAVAFTGLVKAGPPPSPADVGDADSFGHSALYMGAKSGFITLTPACTPAPTPMPPATANDDQCFNLGPAPATTGATTLFTANDILRINLPAKATRTIIYPALNFFLSYQLQNLSPTVATNAHFRWTASVDIESAVLLDPALIDPNTSMPYNGVLTFQFTYSYNDDRTMQIGDRQKLRETLVRVGNAGINKAGLVAGGLPQAVVDEMFKKPMTLRMNVTGSAQYVTDASLTCNMRLFGD